MSLLCRACTLARGAGAALARPAVAAGAPGTRLFSAGAANDDPGAGLRDFWDGYQRLHGKPEPCGRAWRAAELRRKSFDDLHGLWYVCLKERNMLLTERYAAHKSGRNFIGPDRLVKVKATMARIKHVVHERRRAATRHAAAQREELLVAHRADRVEARAAAGLEEYDFEDAPEEEGEEGEAGEARPVVPRPVPRPTFRQQMKAVTRRFQKQDRLRRGGQFRYGKDESDSVPSYEELVLAKAGIKIPEKSERQSSD